MKKLFGGVVLALALFIGTIGMAYDLPPVPKDHFNDTINAIPVEMQKAFNDRLVQFERDTSIQFLVVCLDKLPDGADLRQYCLEAFRAWKVGQKSTNNGLVLFWFKGSRKIDIEVGYGLEGKVTDAIATRIRLNEITPSFKDGAFVRGMDNGINALMLACKGEYQGTGQTAKEADGEDMTSETSAFLTVLMIVLIVFIVACALASRGSGHGGSGGNWSSGGSSGGGGGWYSGGSSGGSSGGGDSGSFSGGGGSCGGGGSGGGY